MKFFYNVYHKGGGGTGQFDSVSADSTIVLLEIGGNV